MSRVQLALTVADLDASIDFYSKLFAAVPAKIRPGYANFGIAEPPVKLVLIDTPMGGGTPPPGRSTTWASRSKRPSRSRTRPAGCRPGASSRRSRRQPPAATRSRTKPGWTTPTAPPGSSTPSWPTPPNRPGWDAPPSPVSPTRSAWM